MGCPPGAEVAVTRVTCSRSPPNGPPAAKIPGGRDSGPANPFGDLVKLFAGEQRTLLKESRNLIEKGSRVGRFQGFFHAILIGRSAMGDGAAPRQRGEELLQLHLFCCIEFREADAHAQERVRGADRARSLNSYAE